MDVYEIVTERIMKQLEQGVVPWKKPWYGSANCAYNVYTKRPYSLLNQMLLKHDDGYMTFNQAGKLGGKVKKGSKPEIVTFWKEVVKDTDELDENGEPIKDSYKLLRYYSVYNIRDIDGIDEKKFKRPKGTGFECDKNCEQVINDYLDHNKGLKFQNKELSNEAYYMPLKDLVVVPRIDQFEKQSEYYSTVFHEFTHSTGHKDRLNRRGIKNITKFGDCDYSKEELVAEMGAAMLCNILKVESDDSFQNSAAYIKSWLKALSNDKRLIVSAGSRARKAVKYILGK